MKEIKKLKTSDLKKTKPLALDFKTTKELIPFAGIIGQEKALKSIKSAMQIKAKGFNLYVSGNMGIGKTQYVMSVVNELSKEESIPSDFCYIYNFEEPSKPLYIELEPGQGYEFKTDMNQFIHKLLDNISSNLAGDTYEKQKKDITSRFEKMKTSKIANLEEVTFKQGFKLNYAKDGITFSPVYNGSVINEETFNKLEPKDKKYFKEKSPSIQESTLRVLKDLKLIDDERDKAIKEWEINLATYIASESIKDLKLKYKKHLKIQDFFYNIQANIVDNVDFYKQYNDYIKNAKNAPAKPGTDDKLSKRPELIFDNYRVNIIIDNDTTAHAPAVLCKSPNYFDLFGNLEFENTPVGPKTNYRCLKPGLIHKANGGYLIINIKDLLSSMPMWEALKRVIRNSEITIDITRDMPNPSGRSVNIKPEAIPVNMNFVLIGSESNYMQLAKLDPDFKKFFKFKAEFENTYDKNQTNMELLARFVAFTVQKHNLLDFTKDSVLKVIDYSTKLAADSNKLLSSITEITDLLIEANYIASLGNKKLVTPDDITTAFLNKKERYSLYDTKLTEMISNGNIMISTDGEKVGQINGLTILNNGDFMFGKPVRITANTFLGRSGIINIEREVSMSGNTHSKGVFILSAYIGQKFAQKFPLSFNASICFEQLYNGVDGDSASSTELYAILSSLAEVPIKQNFAVTGSVNQKGEIQPIGGVSEKIEGFFKICKERGLKNNSVLIPFQNVDNLNLSDEIQDAITEGLFNIYPISHIDEGIELLTGLKAGRLLESGEYEKGSINYKVELKLQKYAQAYKAYN